MSHGENWDDSVQQHLKYRRHFTSSPNNGRIPIPSPTCMRVSETNKAAAD